MANQGIYHPTFNPNGSKLANDNKKWYETTVSLSSISDCFDASKALTASGYIGTTSARADGIFYDQVHESSIIDLRNSSAKIKDYNRLIDREFNKLVAGTYRGSEGEYALVKKSATQYYKYTATKIRFFLGTNGISGTTLPSNSGLYAKQTHKILVVNKDDGTFCIGYIDQYNSTTGELEVGYIFTPYSTLSGALTTMIIAVNGLDVYILNPSTRTKSNTLTHTDIIGNPANYPTTWKQSGVNGVPLIVAEDGTSLLPTGALTVFKLSRKANATPLQVLKSTDSGATWTALAVTTGYTFSTTTNAITMVSAPATTDLVMVTYQTHTSMAVPGVNSEVLGVGNCFMANYYSAPYGAYCGQLIGKVLTASSSSDVNRKVAPPEYTDGGNIIFSGTPKPSHTAFTPLALANGVAVKTFPYLTRLNGKARLQLVFKEMKYNGTSWGDDSKFNIVDNVSTTTDNNAQTVLIGQKYCELPYFISAGE